MVSTFGTGRSDVGPCEDTAWCCSISSCRWSAAAAARRSTRWCAACARRAGRHDRRAAADHPAARPRRAGLLARPLRRARAAQAIVAVKEHGRADLDRARWPRRCDAGLTRLLAWGIVEAPLTWCPRRRGGRRPAAAAATPSPGWRGAAAGSRHHRGARRCGCGRSPATRSGCQRGQRQRNIAGRVRLPQDRSPATWCSSTTS